MEISYFREFAVLAETKNFWAAADRLFIGQSSLSKHIKTLENQLGEALFVRTSRKVELTPFGQVMLPYAQSIAKLQYEYEAAAFNFLNRETAPLEIATIPVMAHYGLIDALMQFKQDHPTVQVNIHEADTLVAREMLLDRTCELAIIRESETYMEHDPEKERRLVKLPFARDRLLAVLPPDHPLCSAESIELSQLADENFALIPPGTLPYNLCVRACQEANFLPNVIFTSNNLEAILDTVRRGSCVALLFSHHMNFPHQVDFGDTPPFVSVPITPSIKTTLFLCYRKGEPLSAAAAYFIEYCKQVKARFAEPEGNPSAEPSIPKGK
ncbi:MAG: LysR family transcriptional regulator [Clostridiales bacterium]|nr:LysR family transcriptional regulator [Clostridiales bacterium]